MNTVRKSVLSDARLNTIDNLIAQAMWDADERPCKWSELDNDEMAEWEKMARAARVFVTQHLAASVQSQTVKYGNDLAAAFSMLVKNVAAAAIREAA